MATRTPTGRAASRRQDPRHAIVVSFAYSPEKEKLLLPLIKEFNAKGETVWGARRRQRPNVASGEAESRIASGS